MIQLLLRCQIFLFSFVTLMYVFKFYKMFMKCDSSISLKKVTLNNKFPLSYNINSNEKFNFIIDIVTFTNNQIIL
jgi:hypothetical protein